MGWPYKRGSLWWEWPYKRGSLWWGGLIRGVAFGGSGLIRGIVFGGSGLIRGVVFGGSGLMRDGLLHQEIFDPFPDFLKTYAVIFCRSTCWRLYITTLKVSSIKDIFIVNNVVNGFPSVNTIGLEYNVIILSIFVTMPAQSKGVKSVVVLLNVVNI